MAAPVFWTFCLPSFWSLCSTLVSADTLSFLANWTRRRLLNTSTSGNSGRTVLGAVLAVPNDTALALFTIASATPSARSRVSKNMWSLRPTNHDPPHLRVEGLSRMDSFVATSLLRDRCRCGGPGFLDPRLTLVLAFLFYPRFC